jgi:hypothetical protein
MLNFSLWFTFAVWSLNLLAMMIETLKYVKAHKGKETWEYNEYPISFMSEFFIYILIPAPAILLEYLIVR